MASDDTSPGPPAGKTKGISRKKKSARQTEVLERAYAAERYPSETTRTVLSKELGLSEKQLQIWFTHRRYKDRRDGVDDEKLMTNARRSKFEMSGEEPRSSKKGQIDLNSREDDDDSEDGYPARVLAEEQDDEELIAEHRNGQDVGNGDHEEFEPPASKFNPGPKPGPKPSPKRKSGPRIPRDPNMPPRKPGPKPKANALAAAEQAAFLAVEGQLGGPLREDGPPLGFEFDPLPPDAFQQLACTEVPYAAGGSREGGSENASDRPVMESKQSKGFVQLEKKNKKKGGLFKPSRGAEDGY